MLSLTADPTLIAPGQSSTLTWSSSGPATLNGAPVSRTGSMTVTPSDTTQYTLASGSSHSDVTVTVGISTAGLVYDDYEVVFTPAAQDVYYAYYEDGIGDYTPISGMLTHNLPAGYGLDWVYQMMLAQVVQNIPDPPPWDPAWRINNRPPWVMWPQGNDPYPNGWPGPGWAPGISFAYIPYMQQNNIPLQTSESGLVSAPGPLIAVAAPVVGGSAVAVSLIRLALSAGSSAQVTQPPANPPPNIIRVPEGQPIPAVIPPNTTIVIVGPNAQQMAQAVVTAARRTVVQISRPPQ